MVARILLFVLIFVFTVFAERLPSLDAMKHYEQAYGVLVENAVNLKTPGYKGVEAYIYEDEEKGTLQTLIVPKIQKGSIERTNHSLDLAIEGDGFFVLNTEAGYIFTRDGRFKIDGSNRLVSLSGGYPVMGVKGEVVVLSPDLVFTKDGRIIQNGQVTDKLLIVNFDSWDGVSRLNGAFYQISDEFKTSWVAVKNVLLRQGFLEKSNADLTKVIVDMPQVSRKYDVNAKALGILQKTLRSSLEMAR